MTTQLGPSPAIVGMDFAAAELRALADAVSNGTGATMVAVDETGGAAFNVVDTLDARTINDPETFTRHLYEQAQREAVAQFAPFYPQPSIGALIRSTIRGSVSTDAMLQSLQGREMASSRNGRSFNGPPMNTTGADYAEYVR